MTKLAWADTGKRLYETGVDQGVFYPKSGPGVAWNGLTAVTQSDTGGDVSSYYLDAVKYLDVIAYTDYKATVTAFSSPPEFAICDGNVSLAPGLIATQQPRSRFDFSYRTLIGNDSHATSHGYKLHLVYNVIASPSNRDNKTLADSPDPTDLSWEFNAVPPAADGYKPTAHLVVDSTLADPTNLAALEVILYGDSTTDPSLPTQDLVIATLAA